MYRWLRVLVCLLLICCILVNLSPLRAEATAGSVATAVTLAVGIPVAVAVGLNALGVRQGSSSTAFNEIVSSCADALSPEWGVNGLTSLLALTTDGITKTFLPQNFLQSILDWGFGSENRILSTEFFTNYSSGQTISWPGQYSDFNLTFSGDTQVFLVSDYMNSPSTYCLFAVWTGRSYLDASSIPGIQVIGSKYGLSYSFRYYTSSYVRTYAYKYPGVPTYPYSYYTSIDELVARILAGEIAPSKAEITTSEDLTLEAVGHDIDTDYETYVETGIVGIDFGVQFEDDPNTNRNEEDDGNDLWLPVGIPGGSTSGSYVDQTQQDAQSGNTPQDVLDELLQNSGSGDGSGDGSGSDSGSSSGSGSLKPPTVSDNTIRPFLFDISEYFPFCIPFDLYDFFTLLNADPVAPVLSWEIKDLSGNSYPISIDLSEWDSVAQLFRRLQLFLFITGLAAASRKFIKW